VPGDKFLDILRAAELDPAKDLRFHNWSFVNFENEDLTGCNFSCSCLIGCNFKGARIRGARFDRAELFRAGLDPKFYANLGEAADWADFIKNWEKTSAPASDGHLRVGAVFQDSPLSPAMVVVPPGKFMMGSKDDEGEEDERPRHEVAIPQAFAIGRFAVTFEEWDTARAAGGVKHKPGDEKWGRGRRPVINVSWNDAQAYVTWLSGKTGKPYRLLSEAEWEYACRAGTETAYAFGDAITKAQARFSEGDWGSAGSTVEVGAFPANDFGIYDMHGNVWEWCEDSWNESYAGKPESLIQTGDAWTAGDGNHRVLRGGSWYFNPQDLRAARRNWDDTEDRIDIIGFRVARTLFTS
jgi:formylglycine-generating enzyme required for sulfatase activity